MSEITAGSVINVLTSSKRASMPSRRESREFSDISDYCVVIFREVTNFSPYIYALWRVKHQNRYFNVFNFCVLSCGTWRRLSLQRVQLINLIAMLQPIVITPKVISTIQSLPEEERVTIAGAIAKEMILGDSDVSISPVQRIIYAMIQSYIRHDSHRFNKENL